MRILTQGLLILLLFCNFQSIAQSASKTVSDPLKDWIFISLQDLKKFSKSDSVLFARKANAIGLTSDDGIVYTPPKTIGNLANIAFGDYMPNHINALIRFGRSIWFTFPIEKLQYYRQSILDDNAKLKDKKTMFNNRINKNYIQEKYASGCCDYSLEYYDDYGMITVWQ